MRVGRICASSLCAALSIATIAPSAFGWNASEWSERQTKAYWDVDAERLSSRYAISFELAGSHGKLVDNGTTQTHTAAGGVLHVEGSIVGVFMRPGGRFYVRDWWTMEGGLGARTNGDSGTLSGAGSLWSVIRFEPALRAVAQVDDITEIFANVGLLSLWDWAAPGGATGLKFGGGMRVQDLYFEASWAPPSLTKGSTAAYMLGAAYRYASPSSFLSWIGVRGEYVKNESPDQSLLAVRLVWGSH